MVKACLLPIASRALSMGLKSRFLNVFFFILKEHIGVNKGLIYTVLKNGMVLQVDFNHGFWELISANGSQVPNEVQFAVQYLV